MGSVTGAGDQARTAAHATKRSDAPPVVRAAPLDGVGITVEAHRGEIVGFAGLAGHGQTEMLLRLYRASGTTEGDTVVDGPVALVAGDRQNEGIFPLWSIARNIGTRSIASMVRAGLVDPAAERQLADDWRERIGIRTPDIDNNILSLSGGNQQKVLFGKWLFRPPRVLLADEPTRGVDVGAKRGIYELIHTLAREGLAVLFISSEHEEILGLAHRVLVMRDGEIVVMTSGHTLQAGGTDLIRVITVGS
jgi:ribose transport system ATP-binding protein